MYTYHFSPLFSFFFIHVILVPQQIGRLCQGSYLENCIAYLDEKRDTDDSDDSTPTVISSSSPFFSDSATTNTSVERTLNASALSSIELEPTGGVSAAAGGYLAVENVSLTD